MRLIHHMLDKVSNINAEKPALFTEDNSITFSDLQKHSRSTAGWLHGKNVQKSDRVLVLLPNCIEAVVVLFACSRVGLICVLLDNETSKDNTLRIFFDCTPTLFITNRDRAAEFKDTHLSILLLEEHWSEMIKHTIYKKESFISEKDIALLVYTSGSTGKPKGIISTHENTLFVTLAIQKRLRIQGNDVIGNFLPLSFDYGLYQVFLCCLAECSMALGNRTMVGPALINFLNKWKVTGFPLLPSLATNLISLLNRGKQTLSLRFITNTGGHLPHKDIQAIQFLLPECKVYLMYGLTECKRVSILECNEINEKFDSVGKPLDGTECYIIDEEENKMSHNKVGQLVVKGAHVMMGYWNDPELSKTTFRKDQLGNTTLYTGDLCRIDEHGYIYFYGRTDDMFKLKGYRVSSLEIEMAVLSFVSVKHAAVVHKEDKIYLFVESSSSAESIKDKLKQILEHYKIPHKIIRLSTMPLSKNGKSDKGILKTMLEGEM